MPLLLQKKYGKGGVFLIEWSVEAIKMNKTILKIDGNACYEIDISCMERKKRKNAIDSDYEKNDGKSRKKSENTRYWKR